MVRMLVVDNEEIQLRRVLAAADVAGIDSSMITIATSPNQARELVDQAGLTSFDLAVVDLSLVTHSDDEAGVDLIRWLHSVNRYCYIIALTLSRGNAGLTRALQAGANDFISLSWPDINGFELLAQKLSVFKNVVESK
jgi:CheY-like chemotaxis protein